jgi:hypothetical protein
MAVARTGATARLLSNGKVLVAGAPSCSMITIPHRDGRTGTLLVPPDASGEAKKTMMGNLDRHIAEAYNPWRRHSSIHNLAPAEYERRWRAENHSWEAA